MARRRGGRGGFFSRSKSRSSSRRSSTTRSRPKPRQKSRTAPQQGGGLFGGQGLMGMMATGMALGVGSSMGHMAVNGVANALSGDSKDSHGSGAGAGTGAQQQQSFAEGEIPCQTENFNFIDCLKFNNSTIGECQSFFNALQECNSTQGM